MAGRSPISGGVWSSEVAVDAMAESGEIQQPLIFVWRYLLVETGQEDSDHRLRHILDVYRLLPLMREQCGNIYRPGRF